MGRSNILCEGENVYCHPLATATEADVRDVMSFEPLTPKGHGLASYLRYLAFPDEEAGEMRTYLVRDKDTDELVGYFSLKAGSMTHGESVEDGRATFDASPGVELANFAMSKAYREEHPQTRGSGETIFRELVLDIVRRTAQLVGVSVVYLFALPDERLIAAYERYGFSRLDPDREALLHARMKPRYDAQCVFMFMRLS